MEALDTTAVVIPCYRCKNHVLSVIQKIGLEVHKIYVIDDCCPEKTGDYVKKSVKIPE